MIDSRNGLRENGKVRESIKRIFELETRVQVHCNWGGPIYVTVSMSGQGL
jgi:hypothetical protein